MADRRLAIEITVEGDATRVFKEIGAAAKQSARDVADSGQRAQQGIQRIEKAADSAEKEVAELGKAQERVSKSADQLEKAQEEAAAATREMAAQSAKARSSIDQYRSAIANTAKGMALLGTAFTLYSRQAREHEITLMAVQRIYGDTADSYVQFANTIQSTTIFSNDEALEAARLMGTLRENYDLTDAQIQKLIQTSADLAAMHGYTLTDAAMRVQSAIRGEAESAEALGLTMNQAAIDTEGLTLSMSNAEAAQFRFNAMMEQTASSVGFAAEAADSTAGKVQQLSNQFQDAMVAIVDFSGPVGDVVASLSSFGVAGGAAAGGLVQVIRGVNDARRAMGGLMPLLGAGGIGIGLGLAALASWKLVDSMTGSGALYEASMRTHEQVSQLNRDILDLASSFQSAALGLSLVNTTTAMGQFAENARADLQAFQELWDKYGDPSSWMEVNADIYAQNSQIADDIDKLRIYIEDFGGSAQEAGEQVDAMLASWSSISMSQNQQAIEDAIAAWQTFNNSMQRESDWDALNEELNRINGSLDEYEKAALAAKAAAEEQAKANNEVAESARAAAEQVHKLRVETGLWSGAEDTGPGDRFNVGPAAMRYAAMGRSEIDATSLAMAGLVREIGGGEAAWRKYFSVATTGTRTTQELNEAVDQLSADMKGVDIDRVTNAFWDAHRAASVLSDTLYTLRQRENQTVGIRVAVNTTEAQQALSSGFNAIVGGTNSMASISKQTADWAGSLAHGNFLMTELDQLFLKGAISRKTYRDALEANHRIQQANVSVQEDVLRIQAKQLPVMAQLSEEHARYVDWLADEDVMTQTVALGYMDQTKAQQAMALATLASTAAMSGMSDVAGQVILDMAVADPVLKAMLIDMGLISEGANGTITMNTDQAVSATDVLSALNDTLNDLTLLLAQVFNVDITATDSATATIDNVKNALLNLDGQSATVFINTGGAVQLLSGAATGAHMLPDSREHARQLLGPRAVSNVPGLATGGHLREINEVGPEMVVLPTGATVINAAGTRGRLDPMGRNRAGGGGTTYKGNVIHQTITYEESALTRRADRMTRRRR